METRIPSFPDVPRDETLETTPGLRWQVLCGDGGQWRCGIYSPPESGPDEIDELKSHDCPELFLPVQGRLTLVLSDGDGGVIGARLTGAGLGGNTVNLVRSSQADSFGKALAKGYRARTGRNAVVRTVRPDGGLNMERL